MLIETARNIKILSHDYSKDLRHSFFKMFCKESSISLDKQEMELLMQIDAMHNSGAGICWYPSSSEDNGSIIFFNEQHVSIQTPLSLFIPTQGLFN